MEQSGIVVDVLDNGDALVRFKRTSACGPCHACFRLGSDEADITIENKLQAKVGDEVEISIHGKTMMQSSMIAYGIPLIFLIVGVCLGSLISEIAALLIGISATLLSFLVLKFLDKTLRNINRFKPKMIKIIKADRID